MEFVCFIYAGLSQKGLWDLNPLHLPRACKEKYCRCRRLLPAPCCPAVLLPACCLMLPHAATPFRFYFLRGRASICICRAGVDFCIVSALPVPYWRRQGSNLQHLKGESDWISVSSVLVVPIRVRLHCFYIPAVNSSAQDVHAPFMPFFMASLAKSLW